jgi:outer membrane immunogenic protein
MKKFLLVAGALTAFFAGPALAADLASPAPVYAPAPVVVVPLYTWTGCYIGGNGGGLWAHRDWSDPVFGFGDFGSQTTSGGLGGFQGGCNYQVGHWVLGVQGDWDWASASGSNANSVFALLTDQSKIKSLASVTLRTGYAWDRFWLYVRGGGAWLQSDLSLQSAGASFATVSETRNGWTIGVGGEYAFLDWLTGFIEYDYYNFRNNTDTFACTVAGCPGATLAVNVTTNVNVIKAGLNFKFGPGARWY